jgi:hypothetical protein
MVLKGGVHLSVGRREGERVPGYRFGVRGNGPWARSPAGLIRSPGPVFRFSFLFFFSFSIFQFLSYYLQKCFKSIQTTFRNFLKINAMV